MQLRLREQGTDAGAAWRGSAGKPAGRGKEAAARKEAWKSCRFSAAAREREIEYRERERERESFVHVSAAAGGGCRLAAAAARGRQIHVLDGHACLPARPPASSGGGGVRGDSNCQNCCHAARGSGGRTGVCTGTATRENRGGGGMDDGGFCTKYD